MKGYYASIISSSGKRWNMLAGPFRSHAEALAMQEPARLAALEANQAEATWCFFGTASISGDSAAELPSGILNERLGIQRANGWCRIPVRYRAAYHLYLHERITGPQVGRKHLPSYQLALDHDARMIDAYVRLRHRNTGCNGLLHTPEMQRRFPHINRQRDE